MGKEKMRYYLAEELFECLSKAQRGNTVGVGSLVDIEDKDFSRLMQILKAMEQRGVNLESVNEPALNGKTYSKLENSIMILKYFK